MGCPPDRQTFAEPRRRTRKRTQAFTLLELLVVLTLIALVAATAAPRLGQTHAKSAVDTAVSQLATVDRQLRAIVQKRHQPAELRFDLTQQVIQAQWDGGEARKDLPTSVRIDTLLSRREKKSSGQVALQVYADGTAESYAVGLIGPNNLRCWLFVAGLSGQVTKLDSRQQAEELLDAIR